MVLLLLSDTRPPTIVVLNEIRTSSALLLGEGSLWDCVYRSGLGVHEPCWGQGGHLRWFGAQSGELPGVIIVKGHWRSLLE